MRSTVIYTLLGIQAIIFSAFIWVIDGRAESRSDTQRAESIIKYTEMNTSVNLLTYKIDKMEEKLDDVRVVWTLQDVREVVTSSSEEMKEYIKVQNDIQKKEYKKTLETEKKKYDIFYLEHEGKLYKIYAIKTDEDKWTTMRTIEVSDYDE